MKILCLLSWQPGSRWIWDYLPDSQDQVDFTYTTAPKDRYPGYGKLFGYYPRYWRLGLQAYQKMHHYDMIVTWEANTAIPLALMRSLSGRKTPPLVVLNFVLKGQPVFDFLPLIQYAMRSVNQVTCISQPEIEYYSKILKYPADKCLKLQGPFRDFFSETVQPLNSKSTSDPFRPSYIFSAGRSNRDYQTLVAAVEDLNFPLIINARKFNVRGLKSGGQVAINPFLPFDEYLDLLARACFAVVPLLPARHASGETFMIQAMTARKAVIASQTYSTAEFIEDRVNGLLVPPGDPQALRDAIKLLIDDPGLAERIGCNARRRYLEQWSFPMVSRQVDHLLTNISHEGNYPI